MARTKRGRRKIEIVRMKNKINLQVTFSKRKCGVFKKASELGTLCGVEIGVIVFSPGNNAFSFGNPDIRSVINRFNNHHLYPLRLIEDGPNATMQDLNNILTQESAKLEMEKENEKSLDLMKNKREETENWWEKPPNQLNLSETTCLIKALENLKIELKSQQSQHFQTSLPQSYNIVSGDNINLSDQRRMIDGNAMNYKVVPNHGPMFGFNNNNNVFEGFPPL